MWARMMGPLHHPGQALKGDMEQTVREDLFADFSTTGRRWRKNPMPQPCTFLRPRTANRGSEWPRYNGVRRTGRRGHTLDVALVEEVRPGDNEDLAVLGVRVGIDLPVFRVAGEAPGDRGQHQGFPLRPRRVIDEDLAVVEEGEEHRFIGQKKDVFAGIAGDQFLQVCAKP